MTTPPMSSVPSPQRYTAELAAEIEARWQDRWEAEGTFHAANPVGDLAGDASAPKYFLMDMFPYPSGAGLHVGHPLGYIATDVVGRHRRMLGHNVLHALGYDAFGLPAELHAISTGEHPRANTEANMANMRRQLRRLGLGHDDRRSFATIDPDFVRWTQWIFLQLFGSWFDPDQQRARPIAELVDQLGTDDPDVIDGHRLAYVSDSPVNWCPGLGTVLANEEVTAEGRSERGNFPVFKRRMRQWNLRITAYGDRLIDDLDRVDWPESGKQMQRNWIGRSRGAEVDFATSVEPVRVFTTRPDTLFGATYLVLAPEHELVDALVADAWPDDTDPRWTGGASDPAEAVAQYRARAAAKTEVERQENREKTGVFTGSFATNPVNGEQVPVFVADYVLTGYGTGAIMAVPAHDARDFEFATAFGLPMPVVVDGGDGSLPWMGDGVATGSRHGDLDLDGLAVADAKATVVQWLETHGHGTGTTTYRLRDWLFSRQRYWGEPFPIVYDAAGHPVALPESMLPVELPEVPDYSPRTFEPEDAGSEPEPPLGRVREWVEVDLDLGDGVQRYRRETNTMPNWAGSSWYELRYTDPHHPDRIADPENERYWMGPQTDRRPDDAGGVDFYIGGVEHMVLHLLYVRFWHKVLFDLGHVSSEEPFQRLFNQGYIQAYAFTDARGAYVPADEVEEHVAGDGTTTWTHEGSPVQREYGKMGKSLKNVVTPDEMYEAYGADTFRVYEMSMGPLDVSRPWDTRAVVGAQRFLQRVWRLTVDEETGESVVTDTDTDPATMRVVHRTIDGVAADMEALRFNTAIAKLIELTNHLTKVGGATRGAVEPLVLMLAPFAPHLAEELWARLGHHDSLTREPYPVADPALLVEDTVTCVVQVRGKVRATLDVAPDAGDDELTALALAEPNVQRAIDGQEIRRIIVRAPKLVNVVV
ncbi:leucine--tRNA ligase [Aeromicrobium marinum DSM 15272]|uniref:Leucine--tRNA ligase n=1 Tax=Aeromicrobium marinum DSM 15272 TaxID=585531 RepID=E2SB55_9ACTN|nr:leucine--tRNA ligase [Aeromicrobium marinum]EFQ83601.1 leucine--tRNA ligase [Aeromicrobium marinum DSM 15272]